MAQVMKELRVLWGGRIERLRVDKGLSRAELARRTGIDTTTVWRIEQGYLSPSDEVRVRLADELGVRVEDVFTYEQVAS